MNNDQTRQSAQPGNRTLRRWWAVLAVIALLSVSVAIILWLRTMPAPAVRPDEDVMGMVIRDPWYDFGTAPDMPQQPNRAAQDRMGAMLAQMGVRWVRLEFHIDGSDLDAAEQIARNDYFIREVAPRYDLKILGLLGYGLIRGQDPRILSMPTQQVDPVYGPGIDNARRIWLDRARMIVDRYQGDVAAYQVLNEPNRLAAGWNDALSANEVAHLHTTFYTFFRHTDRDAAGHQSWRDDIPIVMGAIQPAGSGQIDAFGHLSDTYYVRQLYASAAFRGYYDQYGRFPLDGLGYHPYPQEILRSLPPEPTPLPDAQPAAEPATDTPDQPDPQGDMELIIGRLDEIRAVLEEVGDPQQPFWITEIGYNAGFSQQDAASQAAFLQLVYTHLAAREDVAKVFWFKYEDFPPATGPGAQQWGTLMIPFTDSPVCPGGACYDVQGRPGLLRPAFWAYRDLAGRGDAQPEPPALVVTRGPVMARVGEALRFTALVSRTTATQPLTYTWTVLDHTQVVVQGDRQSSVTLRWLQPGRYILDIEATNAGGTVMQQRVLRVYRSTALHGLEKK